MQITDDEIYKFIRLRQKSYEDSSDDIYDIDTPYEGDESFLADATDKTKHLWKYLDDNYELDVLGVHAEHAVVVRLAVFGEDLLDLRIRLLAGFLDGLLDHAPATVRHHREREDALSKREPTSRSTNGSS